MAAGLAGLGRYTRFVSYSVMIGFLTGISVNIAYAGWLRILIRAWDWLITRPGGPGLRRSLMLRRVPGG